MPHRRPKSLTTFRRIRRAEWLNEALIEIARLEGHLGLLTEEARAAFYGDAYLTPHERLDALYAAQTSTGA